MFCRTGGKDTEVQVNKLLKKHYIWVFFGFHAGDL